jgi:hypothetical protein
MEADAGRADMYGKVWFTFRSTPVKIFFFHPFYIILAIIKFI